MISSLIGDSPAGCIDANSVSLGMIQSLTSRSSLEMGANGAGLRMVRIPIDRAVLKAAAVTFCGISS